MTTATPRIQLTIDAETLGIIKQLALNTNRSLSKVCVDFIKHKIEDDEDAYYAKLVNDMGDINSLKTISSEDMERRLNALQD